MQKTMYEYCADTEATHWWVRARNEILLDFLLTANKTKSAKLLDLGCGSGYFLSQAAKYYTNCTGVETYIDHWENKKFENIIPVAIEDTKLPANSFDLITALDVLEHLIDEQKFLQEINRLLSAEGKFIFTVPANPWLYSEYDKQAQHYRRYRKKQLHQLLTQNHFTVIKLSYFNTLLFPLFAGVRLIEKIFNTTKISTTSGDGKLFYHIFRLEKYLLPKINLPFGVSLIGIAKKTLQR